MYFAAVALLGASLGQPPAAPSSAALPVAQEHHFTNDRKIKLPITYGKDRNKIRQVILFVARNGENTWYQEGAVPPDRDYFIYTAKEDGVYWFTIVIEDLQGKRDITDITKTTPDLKLIVKTAKPRIQVTSAKRTGDTIVIEWSVDDRFPNDNLTRVHFKPVSASQDSWREVSLPAASKSGLKFSAGTLEPVMVRITAFDLASNKAEVVYQFEAGTPNTSTPSNQIATGQPVGVASPPALPPASNMTPAASGPTPATSVVSPVTPAAQTPTTPPPVISPPDPLGPLPPPPPSVTPAPTNPPGGTNSQGSALPATPSTGPISPVSGLTPSPPTALVPVTPSEPPSTFHPQFNTTPPPSPPAPSVTAPGGGLAPLSVLGGGPASPAASNSVVPASPVPAPPNLNSSVTSTTSASFGGTSGTGLSSSNQVGPTSSPPPLAPPAAPLNSGGGSSQMPLAAWTGPISAPAVVEVPHALVINYLTFDLGYEVESHGPSGISRLDLWITRDDGRTWLKWSQHDGKGPSIRVNLNLPSNPQPEGSYGFRIVPVSGAGLSEREPAAGDAPDLRVVVDITPPQLEVYAPVSDPSNPDTLVIQWKATDKNWQDDPITIEWSDRPTGPWQPVATGSDTVLTVGGTSAPVLRRLPNTGQYAWRVPSGLSPRVYLRVCARDAAGNMKEVITRDPILIDLVKPKAKINGILPPSAPVLAKP